MHRDDLAGVGHEAKLAGNARRGMASLFTQTGETIAALSPSSFAAGHLEVDLQRWADTNPQLLNDALPMLSLGIEIPTLHGHAIDNLFVDGNGCVVAAELKRGLSPRDVTAQVIDYAAHVSRLGWSEVEVLCLKRHRLELDTAFRKCFGRALVRTERVEHRLLIMAESYDPRVTDAALYLINAGTPLALLQFTYFEIGDSRLLEVRVALGEIPNQQGGPAEPLAPEEGRVKWLLSSVAEQLPEIARRHDWALRYAVNKLSLTIKSQHWPTPLGLCQLSVWVRSRDKLSFALAFREADFPGFRELIDERRDAWHELFPAEFANPPYRTVFTYLVYDLPMPATGDTSALADIVERTERMIQAMTPIADEYFRQNAADG